MQGTWVWSLIQEDSTCCGATKSVCHNYWACALEPRSHNYWAHVLQLLKPLGLEPMLRQQEKPPQWETCALQTYLYSLQLEKALTQNKDPGQTKRNEINFFKTVWLGEGRWVILIKWQFKIKWSGWLNILWISPQFGPVAQLCLTLCNPMDCSMPGLPVHHQLPEFTQTHVYWVSDVIQPSHSLSSPSPPAFNLSQHQGLFQWAGSPHQMAKVLEFQFQHQSSNEHPGLISFRMDWLDLLAVQETLKGLLQHHSSEASILRGSVFFVVQLSHPYMTTGKTIALTRRNFVGKIMSLLFNMLSRLVITFLPRSMWMWSHSVVSDSLRPHGL